MLHRHETRLDRLLEMRRRAERLLERHLDRERERDREQNRDATWRRTFARARLEGERLAGEREYRRAETLFESLFSECPARDLPALEEAIRAVRQREEREHRDRLYRERRSQNQKKLFEARRFFEQDELEACRFGCLEIIEAGGFGVAEAREWIRRVDERARALDEETRRIRDQRSEEDERARSRDRRALESRFHEALARKDVEAAKDCLEAYRDQARFFREPGAVSAVEWERLVEELARECADREEERRRASEGILDEAIRAFERECYDEAVLLFRRAGRFVALDHETRALKSDALEYLRESHRGRMADKKTKAAFEKEFPGFRARLAGLVNRGALSDAFDEYERFAQRFAPHDSLREPWESLTQAAEDERRFRRAREAREREDEERVLKERLRARENRERDEREKRDAIRSIYERGFDFYQNGAWERAISEWRKIRFVEPGEPRIMEEIRRAERRLCEREIRELKEEERENRRREHVDSLWRRGKRHFRRREYLRAIRAWEEGLEQPGEESRFRKAIARAARLLKQKQRSERRERQIRQNRARAIDRYLFGAHRCFNNRRYREAVQCLEKALLLDPDNIEIKNGILNAEEKIRQETGQSAPAPSVLGEPGLTGMDTAGMLKREFRDVEKTDKPRPDFR
jgi:tetratricopeptide (TPR) repeat protein